MTATVELHDLTDDEVALVKGFVQLLRRRHVVGSASDEERDGEWSQLPVASFADDWANDQDAAYDDWRARYGVPER